jgi:beta-lactamase class A
MPTASTIKLIVLAELFKQAEAGEIDLDSAVEMLGEDRRGGSGILKDLSPGVVATVRDHATLMVALSDNTSTALLVRLLGRDRILASAREWGMRDTKATFERASGGGARDYAASTPRDLVHLLSLIATDAIVSPAACQSMRDILGTQQYHEQIARMLPFHQYQREGYVHSGPLVVRSKSGFMADDAGGVRVDAGIVEIADGPRWTIALMTAGSPDRRFHPDHPGMVLNARISRLVYDAWATPA